MRQFLLLLTGLLLIGACAGGIDKPMGPRVEGGVHYEDCNVGPWGNPLARHPQAQLDPGKVILPWGETCNVEPYTIAVKDNGRLRAVYGNGKDDEKPDGGEVVQYVRVFSRLLEHTRDLAPGEPVRILIFAHGGMTNHGGAVADAERLAPAMIRDGYFPVFLVWNSDFESAYTNYLCCVSDGLDIQQAQKDGLSLSSFWWVPAKIAGDIGSGIFRAPENYIGQVARFQDSVQKREGNDYFLTRQVVEGRDPKGGFPNVVFPPFADEDKLNDRNSVPPQRRAAYFAMFPVRTVTTTFSEAGTAAWDNMVRRTRLAFRAPGFYSSGAVDPLRLPEGERCAAVLENEGNRQAYGSFSLFFTWLECQVNLHPMLKNRDVEITYVGHSMGAIIGNEMVSAFPDLPYKRIVFMGGAASIRDTQNGVFELMRENDEVEFYNLMLHPLTESRELAGVAYVPGGAVPQGSLLEWVDEMFEKPRSREERMVGKWLNVKGAKPLFPADLERVRMRVFPAQNAMPQEMIASECAYTDDQMDRRKRTRCHPVVHADFKLYSFWRDAFMEGNMTLPDGTAP